mmetsp:Transcript_5177/g.14339  ORF Transcript_5177/g.14339 Transcript_5177/m.14339 type:complete len:294 (+) Transcript_5177:512-1393(+)
MPIQAADLQSVDPHRLPEEVPDVLRGLDGRNRTPEELDKRRRRQGRHTALGGHRCEVCCQHHELLVREPTIAAEPLSHQPPATLGHPEELLKVEGCLLLIFPLPQHVLLQPILDEVPIGLAQDLERRFEPDEVKRIGAQIFSILAEDHTDTSQICFRVVADKLHELRLAEATLVAILPPPLDLLHHVRPHEITEPTQRVWHASRGHLAAVRVVEAPEGVRDGLEVRGRETVAMTEELQNLPETRETELLMWQLAILDELGQGLREHAEPELLEEQAEVSGCDEAVVVFIKPLE